MTTGKVSDVDHCLAQTWLNDTVSHAHNKKKEEGEGVSSGVQDCDDDHKNFRANVRAISIHVIYDC